MCEIIFVPKCTIRVLKIVIRTEESRSVPEEGYIMKFKNDVYRTFHLSFTELLIAIVYVSCVTLLNCYRFLAEL